jgi:hypothetical protein
MFDFILQRLSLTPDRHPYLLLHTGDLRDVRLTPKGAI